MSQPQPATDHDDSDDLEIMEGAAAVQATRSSILTLEIPILPPPLKGMVNLESEQQIMSAYIHQADAALSVLHVVTNMLTQSRALAMTRSKALTDYSRATMPDDSDGPIPF